MQCSHEANQVGRSSSSPPDTSLFKAFRPFNQPMIRGLSESVAADLILISNFYHSDILCYNSVPIRCILISKPIPKVLQGSKGLYNISKTIQNSKSLSDRGKHSALFEAR